MTLPAYLTPNDAAKILGVAASTVRNMEKTGRLPVAATTEGGIRLFDPKTVRALAKEREKAK